MLVSDDGEEGGSLWVAKVLQSFGISVIGSI